MQSSEEAAAYPKGEIQLALCETCAFITNTAFNPELHEYSQKYEATQSYSPTFNRFHRQLAQGLIDKYDLHDKEIIEIGCGNGEFLILLCDLGPNRGIGFDPAYDETRINHEAKERITFIPDFYGEKYKHYHGDFVCCKMTLEHIPATAEFLETVRRSIGNNLQTTVFFQIPNAGYVLQDVAFWDIYYEHCSYFTEPSLTTLFQNKRFEVLDVFSDYDDQYLMIEARPTAMDEERAAPQITAVVEAVADFSRNVQERLAKWRQFFSESQAARQRIVIWGSGSKGVAFLTTLGISEEIGYAVDINPHKHGTFMAGSGHEIVGPAYLESYQPDVVIVMNPIYKEEIEADLNIRGLSPKVMTVEWT
jgi:SAM-dependent methyltransferase